MLRSLSDRNRRWRARRAPGEEGFTLLEAMIAILILALAVVLLSRSLIGSNVAAGAAQERVVADGIANQTIQKVDNLGYGTASEGLACPTSSSPCSSDPNGMLHYQSGCWWYSAAGGSLIVPTNDETSVTNSPYIPFFSTTTVDHVAYTIATYPMFNNSESALQASASDYQTVTCAELTADTAAEIPVTVVVEVSWGAQSSQHVSLQTQLFSTPTSPPSLGNCPTATAQDGGHVESHLANPSTTTPGANPPTAQPGGTASIWFLDEAPTTYTPSLCITVYDSTTNTTSVEQYDPSLSTYYYGNSPSNPFVDPSTIVAVHPAFAGSGPNAASPPPGGTFCNTTYTQSQGPSGTNCNVEQVWTFTMPPASLGGGQTAECVDFAAWDHEGDFDSNWWSLDSSYSCPTN